MYITLKKQIKKYKYFFLKKSNIFFKKYYLDLNFFLEKFFLIHIPIYIEKSYLYNIENKLYTKILILQNLKNLKIEKINSTYIQLYKKFFFYSPLYKELNIQFKFLKKFILSNKKFSLKNSYKLDFNFNINSIEIIFEVKNMYLNIISGNLGLINYNFLLSTYQILVIYKFFFFKKFIYIYYSTIYKNQAIISSTKIIKGGDCFYTGIFSPKQNLKKYFFSLKNLMTIYKSAKISLMMIASIFLESLYKNYKNYGINIPGILLEIFIKKITSFIQVDLSGNTSFLPTSILSLSTMNLINQSYIKHGYLGTSYHPILLGITNIVLINSGFLASISFQETFKTLSKIILINNFDWLVDLKARLIESKLLLTGTGWYKKFNI